MASHMEQKSYIFSQHFAHPSCASGLSSAVYKLLNEVLQTSLNLPERSKTNRSLEEGPLPDIIYLCIGTDRATGDCLGPLVGNKLSLLLPTLHIFGTLEQPLHALNLEATLQSIYQSYCHPLLIAIDAGLGRADRVGFLSIRKGPLSPGLALKKQLPPVGDIHIVGTVNVSGFCEHLILQNTRLFIVNKMAETIARALFLAHHRHNISWKDGQMAAHQSAIIQQG